jgi:hypothetical protein
MIAGTYGRLFLNIFRNQHFLNVVFSKDYGLEEDENLVL